MRRLMLLSTPWCFWGVVWMGPDTGCDAGTRSCTRECCTGGARCALVPSPASTSNRRLTFSLPVGNTRLTCTSRRFGIVHKRFTHNSEQYKVHGRHQNTSNTRDTQLSQTQQLSPERCGRGEGRMRALVAGFRNMAAILECPQHPSRRAIQNFCLRDRNLKKIFFCYGRQ